MKNKKGIIGLIMIIASVLLVCSNARADQRTFPQGSIIIPMDSILQPEADHGIFESYGLLYALLNRTDAVSGDPDPIPIFWIVNPDKTSVAGIDFSIITGTGNPASKYDHAQGTTTITEGNQTTTGIYTNADNANQINYSGGPYVIDAEYVDDAKAIIDNNNWRNVNVHIANAPFTADIGRLLDGVPPKIALLNDRESHIDGNAVTILAGYLDIAGIPSTVYKVVTPNEVGGIATTVDGVSVSADANGILQAGDGSWEHNLLWAPHWTAYEKYGGDAKKIISKIGDFLDAGNAVFAECASIENFEYRPPDAAGYNVGPWLTTHDISHDGGTMNAADMIYDDPTVPFVQTGDFVYAPEGGHLHNWQPLTSDNTGNYSGVVSYNAAGTGGSPVVPPDSFYVDTVKRFIHDDTGWDYYVGGYKDGNDQKGFIVYLGGHKYVSCGGGGGGGGGSTSAPDGTYKMQLDFSSNFDGTGDSYTLSVDYTYDDVTYSTTPTPFTPSDHDFSIGDILTDKLIIDLTQIEFDGKKIKNVIFKNIGVKNLTITHIDVTFKTFDAAGVPGAHSGGNLKKFTDKTNDVKLYQGSTASPAEFDVTPNDELLSAGSTSDDSTGPLSDCTAKNAAGVRYVLNTVFDLQSYVNYLEFMKTSPVIYLSRNATSNYFEDLTVFYGSFIYPSYEGHLRALRIDDNGEFTELWDAANGIPGTLKSDGTTRPGSRTIYTVVDSAGGDTRTNDKVTLAATDAFLETAHTLPDPDPDQTINEILDISPNDGDYVDEKRFLEGGVPEGGGDTVPGFFKKPLGGIIHSAPAIVGPSPIVKGAQDRKTVVYVGAADGMLHAFDGTNGTELWGFVPNNLLSKLYDDTLLAEIDMPKAIVDASPTVGDFLVKDFDGDGKKDPTTILVSAQGSGGHYVFAIDITDPDIPDFLWEVTSAEMGYSYRTSLGYINDCDPITKICKLKTAAFVSANDRTDAATAGIRVYAFDVETGEELWDFHQSYTETSNEIPDAAVLVDDNSDGVMDFIIIGDMMGRVWMLSAATGNSVYGTGAQTPVYEIDVAGTGIAGSGSGYPIGSSPAVVVCNNSDVLVFFGTGGADFSLDTNNGHIYGIKISSPIGVVDSDGNPIPSVNSDGIKIPWDYYSVTEEFHFQLAAGEKLYASPIATRYAIFFPTAFGDRESTDPNEDIAGATKGNLHIVTPPGDSYCAGGSNPYGHVKLEDLGKFTGGNVEGGQLTLGTMDGKVVRFGQTKNAQDAENTAAGKEQDPDLIPPERVDIKFWRDF